MKLNKSAQYSGEALFLTLQGYHDQWYRPVSAAVEIMQPGPAGLKWRTPLKNSVKRVREEWRHIAHILYP